MGEKYKESMKLSNTDTSVSVNSYGTRRVASLGCIYAAEVSI